MRHRRLAFALGERSSLRPRTRLGHPGPLSPATALPTPTRRAHRPSPGARVRPAQPVTTQPAPTASPRTLPFLPSRRRARSRGPGAGPPAGTGVEPQGPPQWPPDQPHPLRPPANPNVTSPGKLRRPSAPCYPHESARSRKDRTRAGHKIPPPHLGSQRPPLSGGGCLGFARGMQGNAARNSVESTSERVQTISCADRHPSKNVGQSALPRSLETNDVRLTVRNFFVYKGQRNGADEIRTHDLLHAMQALSQLSYGPRWSCQPSLFVRQPVSFRSRAMFTAMVRGGFEPPTHGFSVRCSTN